MTKHFRPRLLAIGLAVLAPGANGHAIMLGVGNPGTGARILSTPTGIGVKLPSFDEAVAEANKGCGGPQNVEPGSIAAENVIAQNVIGNGIPPPPLGQNCIDGQPCAYPRVVFKPGDQVTVAWRATIPHDLDVEDTGVRIAMHYGRGSSFSDNVLLGGTSGRFVNDIREPAHAIGAVANTPVSRPVTLPEGKTCVFCTLQFLWAAKNDDGFYLGCMDVSVTENGELPNFATLITSQELQQVGKEISELRPGSGADGGLQPGDDGGGSGAGAAVAGVIGGLLAVGFIGYCFYKRSQQGPMFNKTPPPPDGGLPPGWASAVDPASGRNYFVNSATGETSWEPPVAKSAPAAGGPPGPPGPPGGGALPAGWTASTDPASGQQYYVNSITGATQWEMPTARV